VVTPVTGPSTRGLGEDFLHDSSLCTTDEAEALPLSKTILLLPMVGRSLG